MRSDEVSLRSRYADFLARLPVWLRGRRFIWVLGAAVYTLIYSIWILAKWTNPAYDLLVSDLGYLPVGLFSVVSAFYAGTRSIVELRTRRAWQIIAISLIFLVVGDIIYLVLELTRGIGFPDLPDFFYLTFYPLAFIGLISIPVQLSDAAQKKTWKFDLAIITTGIASVLWYLLIVPTAVSGGQGWSARLVAGAYPVMDLLLVTSIASLFFRRGEINTRRALYILAFGLFIYVLADLAYAWLVLQDLYRSGSWVDVLWTLSYFVIGLAALRQSTSYLVESSTRRAFQINWLLSLPPFVVVTTSTLLCLYAALSGANPGVGTGGLYLGTVLTIFMTIIRQIVTMRENSRLVEELNLASERLRNSARVLEDRVRERTRDLEGETNRLRLTAQIARDAASHRDLEGLLKHSTDLIHERFNLFHTAIYLVDQKREYAVLTASSTDLGQRLIAENYRLRLDERTAIAQVSTTGEVITILDTNQILTPLLAEPIVELALPLKIENSVIGVFDVQSDEVRAFSAEDAGILQVLADQLATAIERMRLVGELETKLRELENAYSQFTRENWTKMSSTTERGIRGYRFDNVRLEPITKLPDLAGDALRTGSTIHSNGHHAGADPGHTVAIPIRLRDQTIGVVNVKLKEGFDRNTVQIIESVADRLASAMESARLYEEARMRADRELSISRVTSAISSSTEYEQILQTTVREIGNILNDTEVAIQILEDPRSVTGSEGREQ